MTPPHPGHDQRGQVARDGQGRGAVSRPVAHHDASGTSLVPRGSSLDEVVLVHVHVDVAPKRGHGTRSIHDSRIEPIAATEFEEWFGREHALAHVVGKLALERRHTAEIPIGLQHAQNHARRVAPPHGRHGCEQA